MATGNPNLYCSNACGFQAVNAMSVQFATLLFCLVVVGGSLERLPEAPAVKPSESANTVVSQLQHQEPASSRHQPLDCLSPTPHLELSRVSHGQIFENSNLAHELTVLRQATDRSPPLFF
jgi:hypothetical protein